MVQRWSEYRSSAAAMWLLVVTLLAGCAGPGQMASAPAAQDSTLGTQHSPKRVIAAIQGEPVAFSTTLNPSGTAGSVPGVDAVEELLHAGLANFDNLGMIRPQLADSVPSTENGLWKLLPDGRMETTWRIRPGSSGTMVRHSRPPTCYSPSGSAWRKSCRSSPARRTS